LIIEGPRPNLLLLLGRVFAINQRLRQPNILGDLRVSSPSTLLYAFPSTVPLLALLTTPCTAPALSLRRLILLDLALVMTWVALAVEPALDLPTAAPILLTDERLDPVSCDIEAVLEDVPLSSPVVVVASDPRLDEALSRAAESSVIDSSDW
jgi:hypothetical protein